VGNDIFIEDNASDHTEDADIEQLIGFKLLDEDGKEKGIITNFYEFTANICLEINNSIMVPLHEDLIISISQKDKSITMKIPKGLF
jgi:ribosomal 30S subunit maturation factor RimM